MSPITPMVKQLLILNIILFVGAQLVPQTYDYLSLHYFQSTKYQPWQWITHIFMHANVMHIAFNMFGLYMFGSLLERMWGERKFLFFYFTCGLMAALAQTGLYYWQIHQYLEPLSYMNFTYAEVDSILKANILVGDSFRGELLFKEVLPWLQHKEGFSEFLNTGDEGVRYLLQAHVAGQHTMVGASGAIYGLMVAFAFLFPNAKMSFMFLPFGIAAKYFIPAILIWDLVSGFSSASGLGRASNVAHFAHLGGAIAGFLLMYYWKRNQFNKNRWN